MASDPLDQNPPFVQMTKASMAAERELMRKSVAASVVLNYLVWLMDDRNSAMVSYNALQEELGYSRSMLSRAIKLLAEDRWLKIYKVGNANCYFINSTPFWTDTFDARKEATFTATIRMTSTDQDEPVEDLNVVELRPVTTGPKLVQFPEEQLKQAKG